jgi:DNA mismatch repair protein MutL
MTVPRIQILPEDLINKIAAGEVVERPASVVKELLENSIDAGATRIKIEVQGAGRKLIRVSDNGQGMSKEEAELAVQRHSTSKISKLDDLFNIRTLGFRGEALPSIASVSRMEITTSRNGAESGSRIKIEGGKTEKVEDIGCPAGTTVAIKDLFFNTPARRKFLKSPATEMGHIGNIASKYAIADPNIAFELVSDGKPLLSSSGSGDLKDAVIAVYGVNLIKGLVETAFDFKFGRIYGLISRPTFSRIDKTYENFYVNKRFVRNFLLNRALEEAYRTLIPNNRYPVAILFIDIDPKQVDVNVHPTKREIKFVRTQEVMDAVRNSVAKTLQKNIQGPMSKVENARDFGPRTSDFGLDKEWKPEMADVLFPTSSQPASVASQEIELEVTAVQPLIPIYQLRQTYIVATDGEELVLIDQHAAHERVLYDQISRQLAPSNVEGSSVVSQQSLLIPETVELSPPETTALQENIEYLNSLGFNLEEFGNNSYILRAVPAVAAKTSAKQLLLDLISELRAVGKSVQLETKQENIRKLIACHSAIKAGDKLTAQEINQLIRDLYSTENPLTCPHGRPTMVRISEEELNKRFGR